MMLFDLFFFYDVWVSILFKVMRLNLCCEFLNFFGEYMFFGFVVILGIICVLFYKLILWLFYIEIDFG